MKAELTNGNVASDTWARAHNRLLRARLDDRYLQPIRTIQSNGSFIGEGFAILTLQCSLIEFLAALRLGFNYRNGAQFGENNEYGQSGKLYAEFLVGQPPFSEWMPDLDSAYDFIGTFAAAWSTKLRQKMVGKFGLTIQRTKPSILIGRS